MSDKASFLKDDVESVWIRPYCVFTLSREIDGHHILGRGYDFGYGTKKKERKYFSSILNFIPLSRPIHHGPLRDTVECRLLFLRIAKEKTDDAIKEGRYELTHNDVNFLAIVSQWWKDKELNI